MKSWRTTSFALASVVFETVARIWPGTAAWATPLAGACVAVGLILAKDAGQTGTEK